jgi:hypothetical protein
VLNNVRDGRAYLVLDPSTIWHAEPTQTPEE